jgi:hypothetical protein
MADAVRFANAAAAISVTRMGAQPSAPARQEIEAMAGFEPMAIGDGNGQNVHGLKSHIRPHLNAGAPQLQD